jgi:hypothetical protein
MIGNALKTRLGAPCRVSRVLCPLQLSSLAVSLLIAIVVLPATGLAQSQFRRGDVDGDGMVGARDFALFQRHFMAYLPGLDVPCQDAYDINDDGYPYISVMDLAALRAGMQNPASIPAPGGLECGLDPTDGEGLTCLNYTGCPQEPVESVCGEENVGGTVMLPPVDNECGYFTDEELHLVVNGLPTGSNLEIAVEHKEFLDITHTPGGPGEETEEFMSTVRLVIVGTGDLDGYERTLELAAPVKVHTMNYGGGGAAAAEAGENQFVEADLKELEAKIIPDDGDLDFESLTVRAGTDKGLPSPGGTVLKPKGATSFKVDSAFSIGYQIDFVGAAGGPFSGASGTTTGQAMMAIPMAPQLPSISDWGYPVLIGAMLLAAVLVILAHRLRSPAT